MQKKAQNLLNSFWGIINDYWKINYFCAPNLYAVYASKHRYTAERLIFCFFLLTFHINNS